ncbi:amidohydrolase [Planctomicrobium piriforme]|uniref:Hippurate hydrolase n=1 Tax=Planctomicrobium piriforme TaxID=1576369 RepID=A0A1I3RA86_9PLAN|nr:amidohydrolase [Planctomicrobium piriforme]SFJ42291.1 hippurate hydrolase [Planctomicrobium piriforme]
MHQLTKAITLLVVFVTGFHSGLAQAGNVKSWVEQEITLLIPLYEHLHSHPEVSNQEVKTAARIASELKSAGFEVTTNIGGHGVVGILKNGSGPVVMFRTDLDALPVTEETGLPYASSVKIESTEGVATGVMHACGHDLHMTNFIGLARILAKHRDEWSGTALLIGQPAEEVVSGARQMLEDGLFTRFPKPHFALAVHCDPGLQSGVIGYRSGFIMANTDSCTITMRGRGGHGAVPEICIDPIVQASQLILDLQTIISREISPLESAVITVGAIHGGTKNNIIPNECKLLLTIRSYSPQVRQHLHEAIQRKAKAVAMSFQAPEPIIELKEGVSATYNDADLIQRVLPALGEALGDENLVPAGQSMVAEDFSLYGRANVPLFMYRLGTVSPEKLAASIHEGTLLPSLHSSTYAPDVRPALQAGLTASTAAMLSLMPKTAVSN